MYNLTDDKLQEECGIFGIYSKEKRSDIASLMYYGLYALQHRGQESAGITVFDGSEIKVHKGMGRVAEVFTTPKLNEMTGNLAIGHVRYSTCGDSSLINAQPLEAHCKLGYISVAHNGTLVNSKIIRELFEDTGTIFQTTIDSEIILKLISRKASKGIDEAILDTVGAIQGSYALIIAKEKKLIGIRDPYGIRPLCLGQLEDGSYVLSSESCGLDAIGAKLIRDINPGEVLIIDEDGLHSYQYAEKSYKSPCAFEYIYFARPDSEMDGISVYEARYQAGRKLYEQHKIDADIVIGVPDSGIPSAIGFAEASGIPYGIGLIKNKYIARTFIAPTQELREKAISVKLNVLKANIENKRVVIVDDSLVRGTTSKRLVKLLRDAGAKEVHFRSASPAVKFPCYFGIDTAHRDELIASKKSVAEICKEIGADSLEYLEINNLLDSLESKNYCLGCFNGVYPIYAPMENNK
ncbi:amidophosphoribosyltransferase [Hypnocyclicus thermotrophus]|uniref:Amidophosphoribosyltransferase n=1 Tax=Hypnocyclicus thermotrophus TaxID=1627895 RepID=A0AA46I695_9FUSO|nr:amidophosphoribosyltransferase [Hypnocyclicus thermotrophus]TDT71984.1 amidophosphoribosyltransferase [Hypnocyclicus thermotrophus]